MAHVPLRFEADVGWMPPELARLQPRFALRLVDAKDYAGDGAADGSRARALLAVDAAAPDGLAAAAGGPCAAAAPGADVTYDRAIDRGPMPGGDAPCR